MKAAVSAVILLALSSGCATQSTENNRANAEQPQPSAVSENKEEAQKEKCRVEERTGSRVRSNRACPTGK